MVWFGLNLTAVRFGHPCVSFNVVDDGPYLLRPYCLQTKRTAYSVLQDSARSKLEEQLTEEQLKLFDEFRRSQEKSLILRKFYDSIQNRHSSGIKRSGWFGLNLSAVRFVPLQSLFQRGH